MGGDPNTVYDVTLRVRGLTEPNTCEVCGAPGELKERAGWWAPRCERHETWRPGQEFE
jgi:hypothetical protein